MNTALPKRLWLQLAFERCRMGRWFPSVEEVLRDPLQRVVLVACARDLRTRIRRTLKEAA